MILSHPHIPCYFFFPLPNFPIFIQYLFSVALCFTFLPSVFLLHSFFHSCFLWFSPEMVMTSILFIFDVFGFSQSAEDGVFNLAQTHTHTQARMQELQQYNERPFMTSKYPRQAGAPAHHHGNSSFNWFGCSTGVCECW